MKPLGTGILSAIAGALVVLSIATARENDLRRDAGLIRDSLEASRDTTRRVAMALSVLGQGTQLLQRRAIQTQLERDSLDRALKQERKARAELAVTVRPVDTTVTAPVVVHEEGTHLAVFAYRATPFTVLDSVWVPPAPDLARSSIRIRLDSIPLSTRIGCGAPVRQNNGIRPALVNVTVPEWANLDIRHAETSPDVCNPKVRSWWGDWRTWTLASFSVLVRLR